MKDHREKLWYKARQRIVEEIALRMLTDQISEDEGGIQLPQSWVDDAEKIRDHLTHEIEEEAATERGDFKRHG